MSFKNVDLLQRTEARKLDVVRLKAHLVARVSDAPTVQDVIDKERRAAIERRKVVFESEAKACAALYRS